MFLVNFENPIVIFDTETGGINDSEVIEWNIPTLNKFNFYKAGDRVTGVVKSAANPVLEIGAIMYNPKNFKEVSRFHEYLGPEKQQSFEEYIDSCTRLALEKNTLINKLHLLKNARPGSEVILDFIQWATSTSKYFIPAGKNIDFDIRMLQSSCARFSIHRGLSYKNMSYPLELMGYAIYYFSLPDTPIIPNYELSTICNALGIDNRRAHEAMYDVQMTAECFKIIFKRLSGNN